MGNDNDLTKHTCLFMTGMLAKGRRLAYTAKSLYVTSETKFIDNIDLAHAFTYTCIFLYQLQDELNAATDNNFATGARFKHSLLENVSLWLFYFKEKGTECNCQYLTHQAWPVRPAFSGQQICYKCYLLLPCHAGVVKKDFSANATQWLMSEMRFVDSWNRQEMMCNFFNHVWECSDHRSLQNEVSLPVFNDYVCLYSCLILQAWPREIWWFLLPTAGSENGLGWS